MLEHGHAHARRTVHVLGLLLLLHAIYNAGEQGVYAVGGFMTSHQGGHELGGHTKCGVHSILNSSVCVVMWDGLYVGL